MKNKDISDEELEEELDKAFKTSEKQKDVFSIIRQEKESSDLKEERIKKKFKF